MTVYMVTWSLPGRDDPITRWTHSIEFDDDRWELVFQSIASGEWYRLSDSASYFIVEKDELPPKVRGEGVVEVNHGP